MHPSIAHAHLSLNERHGQLKKLTEEAAELITARARKRYDQMNQTRKKSDFKENDVVFVKDRQIILGVPRPLKTVYSLSPYIVVQPRYTTTLVRRLADNFQQVYHNGDIKKYKALDPMFEDLPKEVKEVLEKDFLSINVTSKDLKLLQQHDPLDLPAGIDLIDELQELQELVDPDQIEISNQEDSSDSETDDEDDPRKGRKVMRRQH